MKTLMLVRHAQATESAIGLADHARELTAHGIYQAAELGATAMTRMGPPDQLLASSAKRTQSTAAVLAAAFGLSGDYVQSQDSLYLAPEDTLWQTVWATGDDVGCLMLVAHNPGLSDMVQAFDPMCPGLKTAQAFCVIFDVIHWHEANPGTSISAALVN